MKSNKVFLYMVIHDLKHPVESAIVQIELLKNIVKIKSLTLLVDKLFEKIDALLPKKNSSLGQ